MRFLMILVLSMLACTSRLSPIAVDAIVIHVSQDLQEEYAAKESLREGIRVFLEQQHITLHENTQHPTYLLKLTLSPMMPDVASNQYHRMVGLELEPTNSRELTYATWSNLDTQKPWFTGVLEQMPNMWNTLNEERKIAQGTQRDLEKGLTSPSLAIRTFVIDVIVQRHSERAVELLCKLLKDEQDAAVVLKAIGGLVSLKDQRAIAPLIELAHRKDPSFVIQVIYAIGAIGGKTAEAYLVTVASGHPSETVQEAAQEALHELQSKKIR